MGKDRKGDIAIFKLGSSKMKEKVLQKLYSNKHGYKARPLNCPTGLHNRRI